MSLAILLKKGGLRQAAAMPATFATVATGTTPKAEGAGLQQAATFATFATVAAGTTPKVATVAKVAVANDQQNQANDPFDNRVTCTACSNLASGNKCRAYRLAWLATRELAADFVNLKQHCDGFAPINPALEAMK
ncbi:hypothetical protein [Rhodoferax sp.]|uniref:hypothetical protein n=1 Tax=Rhodoferax sp. TaxID=50421 RepID=UPI0026224698|nr:hypothetical protein [Rhodoferax sp.]MDD2920231.1 hypothetical protein [Rhodoferax sp.]